jgi:hypothetical protein
MAAVTLSELRERIKREIAREDTNINTVVDEAIRTAIRYWEYTRAWFNVARSTITLAANSDNVSLPSDYKYPIDVRLLSGGVYLGENNGFTPLTWEEFEEESTDSNVTGQPGFWSSLGNTLYAYPTPTSAYTIRLSYVQGDATSPEADGDSSVWFDEGQDVIRNHAIGELYSSAFGEPELGASYKLLAQEYFDSVMSATANRNTRYRLA